MKVQRGSVFRPATNYYKMAGIILITACVQFFMAVNLAEFLFPGYNVSTHTLSDLSGALVPVEPSATIFSISILLFGIMGLLVVFLILKSGGCRLFSTCLALASVGAMGVAIFPSYAGGVHVFFATMTFLFGVLAVLFSYRLGLNVPMVLVSMVLGLLALFVLMSFYFWGTEPFNPLVAYLGIGGAERFIVYPILLYLTALGGYLTSRGDDWVRLRFFSAEK